MAIVSKTAQLVALYNAANPTLPQALVEADVDFALPDVYTPADGGDTRNTKLVITAKAGSTHFENAKELHYTREPVNFIGAKAVTDDQADWDTDSEVLAFFNADVIAAGYAKDEFIAGELLFTRTDGEDADAGKKIINVEVVGGNIKFLPGIAATYTITQEIVKTDLSTTDGELGEFA